MNTFKDIITQSFTQYSAAVAQSRALIDVRDCLKPSARQIFYSLYTDKFLFNKPYKKTLKAVGSLARYYIHGDASAVGVLMRAGQSFSMRYPLMDINGNAGTLLESGNWAHQRYTESRLSELACNIFNSIDKNVINDWRDNYDNTEQYPGVLPSKGFYNIVNGTLGIAVGLASSIPQFNLTEVNKALIYLLEHPDCSFEEIYCAPDFATGALLLNEKEVKESLKNGNGSACKLRSVIEYDIKDHCLIVKEIPYGVYTNTICGQLEAIINSEDNPGINRFNDLTGTNVNIKIYLLPKVNPDRVIKYLYKNTSLQYYYGINMTMLDEGKFPKVFTWKEALQAHINHEKIIYRKGFEYDLNKINYRIHIINGLLICLAAIEEVIQTIKASPSAAAAKIKLQEQYLLDEEQAKAVLDMKLSRLANLEVQKLKDEKNSLEIEKNKIENILNNENLFNQELINGWKEVIKKFGDERRTKIINIIDDTEEEQEIVAEKCIVILTENNTIKRVSTNSYRPQGRNGKGIKNQEDITSMIIRTNTQDYLMIFTNQGNMYRLLVDDIPEGTNASKGFPVDALVEMNSNEKAQVIYSIYRDTTAQYICFVTKQGIIKKTSLDEYLKTSKKKGLIAIKLREGDEIASAFLIKDENVFIFTKKNQGIRFKSTDVGATSRITTGIKGIELNKEDEVLTAIPIRNENDYLAIFSENGMGKKFPVKDITIQGRGGKGQKYGKDPVAAITLLDNNDTILVVGNKTSICVKASDIPISNKNTIGNIIIKGNIVGVSKI